MRSFLVSFLVLCPLISWAAAQKYEVTIDGMTCADCAKSVTMALGKIPNVEQASVKVSLKAKNATLTMNETDKDTETKVRKAIEDAGYTVKSIHMVATSQPAKH